MNLEDFKKCFNNRVSILNKNILDDQIKMFYEYMNNILKWNEVINLTSITDENEFIVKHYVDSLTALSEIDNNCKSILDIGTGAGFPGIPLKLTNTDKKVVLIDSVGKKLNCIKDSVKDFKLNDLEIKHIRAEDLAKDENYREKFDVVTTRAVSNLATIAEYMLPFVKVGGKAVCMKGPNYKEELEQAKKAIEILGGKVITVKNYNIEDQERNNIIIEKIKSTPKQYPRGQNKPLKEPLV